MEEYVFKGNIYLIILYPESKNIHSEYRTKNATFSKILFLRADVSDTCKQFVKVIASAKSL